MCKLMATYAEYSFYSRFNRFHGEGYLGSMNAEGGGGGGALSVEAVGSSAEEGGRFRAYHMPIPSPEGCRKKRYHERYGRRA